MRSPGKVRSKVGRKLASKPPHCYRAQGGAGVPSPGSLLGGEGLNSGKACHLPGGDNDCVGFLPAQLGQPLERVLG